MKRNKVIVAYTVIRVYDKYRNGGIETDQVAVCTGVPKLYQWVMQRLSELNENRAITEEYRLYKQIKKVKSEDLTRKWNSDYQVPADAQAVVVTSKCGCDLIDEKGYYSDGVWKRLSDDTEIGNVVMWQFSIQ